MPPLHIFLDVLHSSCCWFHFPGSVLIFPYPGSTPVPSPYYTTSNSSAFVPDHLSFARFIVIIFSAESMPPSSCPSPSGRSPSSSVHPFLHFHSLQAIPVFSSFLGILHAPPLLPIILIVSHPVLNSQIPPSHLLPEKLKVAMGTTNAHTKAGRMKLSMGKSLWPSAAAVWMGNVLGTKLNCLERTCHSQRWHPLNRDLWNARSYFEPPASAKKADWMVFHA